jgi:RimJ/RimL family protein N-acetyltransferase
MINFQENIILENELVILRPLETSDFNELLYFSENEPDLWFYSLIPANGRENLEKYINFAFKQKNQKTSYTFVVIYKKEQKIVGLTRFYDIQEKHKSLQLGYTWYGNKYQGTKINKNCKFLLLEFAFEKWKMERVEFRADNNNVRSIAAMKSIGCIEEGILRSNCTINKTERRDSIVLSILKNEWYETIKANLNIKI